MDKKQTILLCAFRYALGRKTYIASELVEFLIEDWDIFEGWTHKQIQDDISHAIEYAIAGDSCDVFEWKKILELKVKE